VHLKYNQKECDNMGNYGKILTPLGLAMLIPGGIMMGNDSSMMPMILLGLGALHFFTGLARLVQGKDRKVLGQIIRPKAAARSSIIWAFMIFNITPLYLPGSRILDYTAPLPMLIWMGEYYAIDAMNYIWVPGVCIFP